MSLWARVKGALTRAPSPVPLLADSASVIPNLPLWQQYRRIGGGLTPSDVSSILYQADAGYVWRLVDLANESRQKDGHLQSNLATREQALSTLPMSVRPFVPRGASEPRRRDVKVAEFVSAALTEATGEGEDYRGFADLVPHMQSAVFHGYASAETAWRRDGSDLRPAGFKLIPHRRFKFRQRDGRLVWWDLMPLQGGDDGVELLREYPGQFIQHQPRTNGDAPAREGLARLLVWCALFRNWDLADWLKLAELSWKPWRVGKYSKTAGKADRENLLALLEALTSNGVGIVRDDMQVDVHFPQGSGSSAAHNHKELAEFLGAEMSKAILGQTLTTEAGARGARALGEVHDQIRRDLRNADARAVAATLRAHLVEPLVRLNFGDAVGVPEIVFETDDAVDLDKFASAVVKLQSAGMRIPVAWAHDVAGVPLPGVDEDVLGEIDVDLTELEEEPPPSGDQVPEPPVSQAGTEGEQAPSEGDKPADSGDAEPPVAGPKKKPSKKKRARR